MALFRSERGIGRGEVAESQLETPFFALFMVLCALILFVFHVYVGNASYTTALAVSLFAFGATVLKVDIGMIILIIAMLLSPEVGLGSVGDNNELQINLRYDDLLIIPIFFGIMVKLALDRRHQYWLPSPVNLGIAGYVSVCVLSTAIALWRDIPAWDRDTAFFVLLKMIQFYMIFFLVGNAIRSQHDLRRYLTVFFVVATIVSLYCAVSIGTLDRVSAPFEQGGTEPNTLGGYLTIVMVLAFCLLLNAPQIRQKAVFGAVFIIAFVPFLYTLSRASYLAILCAVVVIAIVARRPVLLAALAVILVLSPFIMPDEVIERVLYTFQPVTDTPFTVAGYETDFQVDSSTEERLYVWRKARFNLRVFPLLGGGISWDTVLDSQYARVIIETGLIGLLAFVFLQIQLMRTAWQSYQWATNWVGRSIGLSMVAIIPALNVHSAGTISFLIVRIMEPFWFLMALAVFTRLEALADYGARMTAYREAVQRQQQEALEALRNEDPEGKPELAT